MSLFGQPVEVPVVDVNSRNIQEVWPSLRQAISSASFIGIDTELSGLGDRKHLNSRSVEDRYRAISIAAKSRSVLSLGLSCFKAKQSSSDSTSKWQYHVQTYNIMVLCEEDYVVEPASLKFLVHHGFDFNRQYATGISYYRGNDKEKGPQNTPSVRGMFNLIVSSQIPLVFHNPLVDLVFLYQNFYADLPKSLTSFVSDVNEMFPGGIFDTKYITDFIERFDASYLEYVFMQCQRDNTKELCEQKKEVYFEFPSYPECCDSVGYHKCGFTVRTWTSEELERIRSAICLCFAAHGWCGKSSTCKGLHDVDLVISTDFLLSAKQRRNKTRNRKRKINDAKVSINGKNVDEERETKTVCEEGVHCKENVTPDLDADILAAKKAKLLEKVLELRKKIECDVDEMKCREDLNEEVLDNKERSEGDIQTTFGSGSDSNRVETETVIDSKSSFCLNVDNGYVKQAEESGSKLLSGHKKDVHPIAESKIDDGKKCTSLNSDSCTSTNDQPDEINCDDKAENVELSKANGISEVKTFLNSKERNKNTSDKMEISKLEEHDSAKAKQLSSASLNLSLARSGGHRAGFDAFMTGAIFCVFISKHSAKPDSSKPLTLSNLHLESFINKIYLSGKDIPLSLTKSHFSKTSSNHKTKLGKLKHAGL